MQTLRTGYIVNLLVNVELYPSYPVATGMNKTKQVNIPQRILNECSSPTEQELGYIVKLLSRLNYCPVSIIRVKVKSSMVHKRVLKE